MRQVLSIFVLLAFAFSASGLSKHIQAQATQVTTQISIASVQDSITKCCANEEDQSENQKPRCMGDICLEIQSVASSTLGFGNKLPLLTYNYTSTSVPSSFLRPPIA